MPNLQRVYFLDKVSKITQGQRNCNRVAIMKKSKKRRQTEIPADNRVARAEEGGFERSIRSLVHVLGRSISIVEIQLAARDAGGLAEGWKA